MNSPNRFCKFIAWVSVLAVGLPILSSLALSQEIPPPQAARRALERGQLPAEQLLRLLELPAVQKALVLTDEQREKIRDISHIVCIDVIRQQAELRIQRLELQRMMQEDAPHRPAIDKKVQEVAQAQGALMHTRVNALLNLRDVLTKEQRDKVRESVAKRVQQRVQTKAQQPQPAPKLAPPIPPAPAKPKAPTR